MQQASGALAPAPVPPGNGDAADVADVAALVLLAGEQDRDALADALHDGAVQHLVAARWAADAGDTALVREAVQTALVELRRALWHLRPRGADLAAALQELVRRLDEAGGRPVALDAGPGAATTPAGAALAYRLVQDLAGAPGDGALRVRLDGDAVVVRGADAPDDRWAQRARALGGDLTTEADALRLTLPRPEIEPRLMPRDLRDAP